MKINKKLLIPVSLGATIYLLSYGLPKLIVNTNDAHYLMLSIDNIIPLFSPSVIIYLLAFLQWAYTLHILLQQDTKTGYTIASAIIIGSLVGMITFLVYPTAITRPQIEIKNIFDWILNTVYCMDSIVNSCPSFHCFCSTMAIIILVKSNNINKNTLIINIIFSVLVFISTLLTKQHYFIDIPCGIVLANVSMLIAYKFNFNKLFEIINKKILG